MDLAPRIIHLMYFPWGKDQKLLADQDAFDHRAFENMKRYAPDFEVKLWTYPKTKAFCEAHYPYVWDAFSSLDRPVSMVDALRFLVVYHYGGIYWQYDMNPLAPMGQMLPSEGKLARVFTEGVLTPEECLRIAAEPIREGVPEEPLRILTQVFSAVPGHRFMKAAFDFILMRIRKYRVVRDYDLLFVSANAAASTAFDLYGKDDPTIELISKSQMQSLVKILHKGRWRTGAGANTSGASQAASAPLSSRVKDLCRKNLKALPGLRDAYYRFVQPHFHETAFAPLAPEGDWPEDVAGALRRLIDDMGIRSVLEFPCGEYTARKAAVFANGRYLGGDLSREAVAANRRRFGRGAVSFRFMNLMYSRPPRVDLTICRNYLLYLGYNEIALALRALARHRSGYLLTTTFPLLNINWDTALGDGRPLNFTLAPFSLAPPLLALPDPEAQGRTDRSLGLWRLSDIAAAMKAEG